MNDALVFPDPRACFQDLIDGTTHVGVSVRAVWFLPADSYGKLLGPFPVILIYVADGTEGAFDRVDRVKLECYAPGTQAVNVLESVKSYICGADIETAHGYLDSIRVDQVPVDVPYPSDTLNKAEASFLMTSRPIN